MKRRDFFAYLPSISAIPFIGAEILKSDEKIEIIRPKIIESAKIEDLWNYDLINCEIQIVHRPDGRTLGRGYLTNITFNSFNVPEPPMVSVEGRIMGEFIR